MKRLLFILLLLASGIAPAQEFIRIETNNNALIFRVDHQKLRQVWYGDNIGTDRLRENTPVVLEAYSTFGTGETNEVALRASHVDGNTSTELVFDKVTVVKTDENITTTRITLRDAYYPFHVDLVFRAYTRENIIEQWAEISHNEEGNVTLYNFASAQLGFKAYSYWLTQLHGDWGNEMNLKESCLTEGIKIIDSKLGARATMYATPSFLVSLNQPATEKEGEVIGASLAWPGSFQIALEINRTRS